MRVHEAAGATFPHEPLVDGTEIELGDVVVRTIHTPGHRPEHCAFAVIDRSRGDAPWLVLTGDSLFVGEAARPDLAIEPTDGARQIWASASQRSPTDAGSAAGTALSASASRPRAVSAPPSRWGSCRGATANA